MIGSVVSVNLTIDAPNPISKLNNYPAKQPVTAMTPNPVLAIDLFEK